MNKTTEKTRVPASAEPAPTAPHGKLPLTVLQQIEHLKSKGVTFELCGEGEAARMLTVEAPYFSLTCYRHLFEKRVGGPRNGQYVSLDFGHLAALHTADVALRAALLQASLDVEQAARARLNACMMEAISPDGGPEDGYAVVEDFLADQGPKYGTAIKTGIDQLANDEYSGAIVRKYQNQMPAWVFLELTSFGVLCRFYRFCADRWSNRAMRSESFLLRHTKDMRNACAHGSAVLNNIVSTQTSTAPQAPAEMLQALADAGVSRQLRRAQLAGRRMRQIATTLYARAKLVNRAPAFLGTMTAAVSQAVLVLPENNPVRSRLDFVMMLTRVFELVN